ncbi:MAG: LuxR C-terminal-related transcriptional regulator [Ruminiclostridium sp.]
MKNLHTESNIKKSGNSSSFYKIRSPMNDSDLIALKLFLSTSYDSLFISNLYYNFVILLDTNLSIVSFHENRELMISDIKLCTGLNFKEENMGKTSVSECFNNQDTSVMDSDKNENPAFHSLTNCTIPIIVKDKAIAYLSAFFLHSKNDEFSVDYFKLFARSLESSFKLHSLEFSITEYACKIMLPAFSTDSLSTAELEVLNQLNKGYSNKEISNRLFKSENTVKSCVQIISQKLSCSNRTQIAVNSILYSILKLM